MVLVFLPSMLFLNSQQSSSALLALASHSFQFSSVESFHKLNSLELLRTTQRLIIISKIENVIYLHTSTTYINKHRKKFRKWPFIINENTNTSYAGFFFFVLYLNAYVQGCFYKGWIEK
jgi:hypothetical protein